MALTWACRRKNAAAAMSTLPPERRGCVTYKQGYHEGKNWFCQRQPNCVHALELHFRARRHLLERWIVDCRLVGCSANDPVRPVETLPPRTEARR